MCKGPISNFIFFSPLPLFFKVANNSSLDGPDPKLRGILNWACVHSGKLKYVVLVCIWVSHD